MVFNFDYLRKRIETEFGTEGNFAGTVSIDRDRLASILSGSEEFTVSEMVRCAEAMHLSESEVDEIFFSPKLNTYDDGGE